MAEPQQRVSCGSSLSTSSARNLTLVYRRAFLLANSLRAGGAICTAVYTTENPKGKGSLYFYSKPTLVEARRRREHMGYTPSLLFDFTLPAALCYTLKNLSSTLSMLLDVVPRFVLSSGADSLSHSKRKCISGHVFSLRVSCQGGYACQMPRIREGGKQPV